MPSVTFYLTGRKTNVDFKKSERMAEIIFLLYFHLLISKVKGRRKWLPLVKGSWERLEDMEAWIYGLQTELEWRVIWSESESWSLLEKSTSRKTTAFFWNFENPLSFLIFLIVSLMSKLTNFDEEQFIFSFMTNDFCILSKVVIFFLFLNFCSLNFYF